MPSPISVEVNSEGKEHFSFQEQTKTLIDKLSAVVELSVIGYSTLVVNTITVGSDLILNIGYDLSLLCIPVLDEIWD